MNNKLILFDIDGTLMYHVGPRKWEEQYQDGMKAAYGITEPYEYAKYNGSIERHMAWDIVQKHDVSRQEFLKKFPLYVSAMREHLVGWAQKGPVFQVIPEAMKLVQLLAARGEDTLGILTGNAESIAYWKLSHTGYDGFFSFGMFGEEADDRIGLAKLVFAKAKKELNRTIEGKDIVVLGDTVHDIRCGQAIGATTIAVTTGMHADPAVLQKEQPTMLVSSLMDPQVLAFFGLS
jgi:phosphoglycolate phosphatase-like HAD superfamily hydrolase